jgi:ribosomal protein L12E/L44/L45/RPP1/RPP2
MADLEQKRVTALWREAAAALEGPSIGELLAVVASESSANPFEGSARQREAWDEIKARFSACEAECGRLREQLAEEKERRQRDFEHANYIAKCAEERVAELREQLRAALRRIPRCKGRTADGFRCASPQGHDGAHSHPKDAARAALGVVGEQE